MPRREGQLIAKHNKVLTVQGASSLIANMHAAKHSVREGILSTNRARGQATRDRAVQLAPKDTGYMARNIKWSLTPKHTGFDVFCDPDDYLPHGLPFYPFYVELGTHRMTARPFLRPAFEMEAAVYAAELSTQIKQALRSGRGRRFAGGGGGGGGGLFSSLLSDISRELDDE